MTNCVNLFLSMMPLTLDEVPPVITWLFRIVPLGFIVVGILFVAAIIFNIYLFRREYKKNSSARTTFVPFSSGQLNEDLPMPEKNIENKCMYCGQEIVPGSVYCNHCGKKQVQKYQKIFNRQNMSNAEFIQMINTWLASNNRIANVDCRMLTNTGYGLLVNRYFLDSVALEFELLSKPNANQYALVEVNKFGLRRSTTNDLVSEWKTYNPTARIIKTAGGTAMRGNQGMELVDGLGSANRAQVFIFFKTPKNA